MAKTAAKTIAVKQQDGAEIAVEVLAANIIAMSDGVHKLRQGRLNDKALFLLIQHAAPALPRGKTITIGEIKTVLAGIEALKTTYVKR